MSTPATILRVLKGAKRVRFEVKKTDKGLQALKRQIDLVAKSKAHVKAGLMAGGKKKAKGRKDGLGNVTLGLIHEFGSSKRNIPSRPFVGAAFFKHRVAYHAMLAKLVSSYVLNGRGDLKKALGILGARMAADIKKYVTAGSPVPPPNSPAWFARKVAKGYWNQGKARKREGPMLPPRTLVDTGQMINSVTWSVVSP